MNIRKLIIDEVKNAVKKLYNIDLPEVFVEHPENEDFGDYATNVPLELASVLKQSPMQIAKNICYEISDKEPSFTEGAKNYKIFENIEMAPPGFINLKLSKEWLQVLLLKFSNDTYDYEVRNVGNGKRIALEHSNVNPNKAAHVGHLRNACIGQFIEHIYEFMGYNVEVQYYSNDLGVQVATSSMGTDKIKDISTKDYKKFDHYMWDVYSKMTGLIAEDPMLKKEFDELLVKIDDQTSQEFKRQKELAQKVLFDNLKTFQKLGFDYDVVIYESDIAALKLWEKAFGLLKQNENFYFSEEGVSKGCWLVKISDKDVSSVVKDGKTIEEDKIIVRSNGVATYTGKDIAYHMWKYGLLGIDFKYVKLEAETQVKDLWATSSDPQTSDSKISFSNVDKVFDVIDIKQTYAINVVKQSLEYLGYEEQAKNMVHVNYGFVYLSPSTAKMLGIDISDGKNQYGMSGRKGWGIKIDDFVDMVDEKLEAEHGSFTTLSDVRNGAIKFEMLKYNTFQDLVFDLDQALNIKGFSGPYLQYTFARANSVLMKAGLTNEQISKNAETSDLIALTTSSKVLLDPKELSILRCIYRFPEIIERAALEFAPNALCAFLFELSQRFNLFYNDLSILNSETNDIKNFRLLLTLSVSNVLRVGLGLLGINAPEKM